MLPADGPTDRRRSRVFAPYWAFLFVAITVALSVIAAGTVADHRQQEEKHAAAARLAAIKMAADFEHHLDQLAEDARLVAEPLWQTGQNPPYPPAVRQRVFSNSVRALSSAVHYCRGVSVTGHGQEFDVALDPTEEPALADWLKDVSKKLTSTSHNVPRLLGPMPGPGDRPFFAQVQHQPLGTVVAAVDTRRLFETLQHGRPPDSRFVLVDASDTLWVGCGSLATCQAVPRTEWERNDGLRAFMAARSAAEHGSIPERLRHLLSLSATADMAIEWQALEIGDASLALGLVTSRSELETHRRAEFWRLLAIGAGMLLSAGIVVVFLWRQRQQESALHQRLRHAEELNRLEHQLVRAEKLATVGVLTAGLAHELGTPLAIIRGRAEILEEQTKLPEIKTILDQSDHIASTLRQVLDFSREQPVSVRTTDVVAALRTVAGLLDFRLRNKNIACQVGSAEGVFFVAADPDQLQQVLVNLVMNACDACDAGGQIVLRASRDPGAPEFVRVDVTDDGCGIPVANLDAVFDPFFTTKPKGEGTGLGLPVAASIVRNHQGQISISSREGNGTTVTVLWPESQGSPS